MTGRRTVAAAVALVAVLAVLAACGDDGGGGGDPAASEDAVTLRAVEDATDDELEVAGEILEARLVGSGFEDASATIDGDELTLAADGLDAPGVAVAIRPAELQLRAVLGMRPEVCAATSTDPGVPGEFGDAAEDFCWSLGPAVLTGEAVVDATARELDGQGWTVDVEFATGELRTNVAEPFYLQQVAIVLDGTVLAAPTVQDPNLDGSAVISSEFTEREAKDLATALRYGALPLRFEILD